MNPLYTIEYPIFAVEAYPSLSQARRMALRAGESTIYKVTPEVAWLFPFGDKVPHEQRSEEIAELRGLLWRAQAQIAELNCQLERERVVAERRYEALRLKLKDLCQD